MTPLPISFETRACRGAAGSSGVRGIEAQSHLVPLVRRLIGREREHGSAQGTFLQFHFGVQLA